ncbi:hypothetical protein C0Q70_17390 [Pomacea canaliculata]|uniref:Uncharacterized protein n=2 Tax=Pomacea canaliculata TaxID=400727 RepID=A0A2T7NK96_POMCA|nr:hypothetical protein C0Q70_17390 [Pomacea canaliculata]
MEEYKAWRTVLPKLMELTDTGQCLVVVTCYPHVLLELQALEKGSHSFLLQDTCTVSLKEMAEDERKEMLYDFLSGVDMMQHEKHALVERVLKDDISGATFPWCCARLVQRLHNSSLDDPSDVFTCPAESYVTLLHRMLMDPTHGETVAALLCLTMMGLSGFLHNQQRTEKALKDLGFRGLSSHLLEKNASFLKNTFLSDDCSTFSSRVLYDAVGLAFGRSHYLPALIKICDMKFLAMYVGVGEEHHESFVTISMNSPHIVHLMERILSSTAGSRLLEVTQYLSLQSKEFLCKLEEYSRSKKTGIRQLVKSVDTVHKLPLLYWSAWTGCDWLVNWCLDISIKEGMVRPSLLESAFVWALAQRRKCQKTTPRDDCRLIQAVMLFQLECDNKVADIKLPFPDKSLLSEQFKVVYDEVTSCTNLFYLGDQSLLIPPSTLTMDRKGESLHLKFGSKQVYLALRLLSDTLVSQVDSKGNTLLHVAAEAGDEDVVDIVVRSGASLTARNNINLTPPQVAQRPNTGEKLNRCFRESSGMHKACETGDIVTVKRLLCCGAGVEDKGDKDGTPLHAACLGGHTDIVSLLLELGVNVHAVDRNRSTALHVACDKGRKDIASLLIKHGGDVHVTDTAGRTPLHAACRHGNKKCASLLLAHGSDIEKRDNHGKTSLFLACSFGHTELVEMLIDSGSDLSVGLRNGVTPLHKAAVQGDVNIVELLTARGARLDAVDDDGRTPLLAVVQDRGNAQENWKRTAEVLVRTGADINAKDANGSSLVHYLLKDGDKDALDCLLELGADINAKDAEGYTPLHIACREGKNDDAIWLTKHGADPKVKDTFGYTALHWACRCNHMNIVQSLVSHDKALVTETTNNGEIALHLACIDNRLAVAEILISKGSNINAKDNIGFTPLHTACVQGNEVLINRLIKTRPDVKTTTVEGKTPLHIACENGQGTVAELLIDHGAVANATTTEGQTPLHYACKHGYEDITVLLLDHEADINAKSSEGQTALHFACQQGQKNIVTILQNRGADINARSTKGDTPADCAQRNGHIDIVSMLNGTSCSNVSREDDIKTPVRNKTNTCMK